MAQYAERERSAMSAFPTLAITPDGTALIRCTDWLGILLVPMLFMCAFGWGEYESAARIQIIKASHFLMMRLFKTRHFLRVLPLKYERRFLVFALKLCDAIKRQSEALPKYAGRCPFGAQPSNPLQRIQGHGTIIPNVPDQRPGATGSRHATETSSPGSLHPIGWARACLFS